jgi:hypothetical protein
MNRTEKHQDDASRIMDMPLVDGIEVIAGLIELVNQLGGGHGYRVVIDADGAVLQDRKDAEALFLGGGYSQRSLTTIASVVRGR